MGCSLGPFTNSVKYGQWEESLNVRYEISIKTHKFDKYKKMFSGRAISRCMGNL